MKQSLNILTHSITAVCSLAYGIFQETQKSVELIIGEEAAELERFAASELQGYLKRLFGVSATIANSPGETAGYLFILGNPNNNPVVTKAVGEGNFPQLSEQGFLLRKTTFMEKPTMVIAGGSPVAAMWGVYELPPAITNGWESSLSEARTGMSARSSMFNMLVKVSS